MRDTRSIHWLSELALGPEDGVSNPARNARLIEITEFPSYRICFILGDKGRDDNFGH